MEKIITPNSIRRMSNKKFKSSLKEVGEIIMFLKGNINRKYKFDIYSEIW